MKPGLPWKQFGAVFLGALVLYALFFSWDAHLRNRKGAWIVTFANDAGRPIVTINEPRLGIQDLQLNFEDETLSNVGAQGTVVFDRPGKTIPYGIIKFEDLTYLPGAVVFDFFGHEVQLLPRTLTVDKKEVPWHSNHMVLLKASEKLPAAPAKPQRTISRGMFEKQVQ